MARQGNQGNALLSLLLEFTEPRLVSGLYVQTMHVRPAPDSASLVGKLVDFRLDKSPYGSSKRLSPDAAVDFVALKPGQKYQFEAMVGVEAIASESRMMPEMSQKTSGASILNYSVSRDHNNFLLAMNVVNAESKDEVVVVDGVEEKHIEIKDGYVSYPFSLGKGERREITFGFRGRGEMKKIKLRGKR